MRVLYLNSGNLFGGIETLLLTLAQHRQDCPALEPEFAVCFAGRFSQALQESGVPVHLLGPARMSRPWQVWRARRALAKLLRTRPYEVAICHGSWSLALLGPVLRQARLPLVYWTHDRVQNPLPWQERWAALCPPDLVIANSRYSASGQGSLFAGIPQAVLYCALTPPRQRYDAAACQAFRAQHGAAPDTTVILQVSRLDPHKGHSLHLQALARLTHPNWVCWMTGSPQRPAEQDFLRQLQQEAHAAGIADRVHFLGWLPEVGLALEACDVFAQPNSGPEPFGLTFVEALWRAKPVVTTAMAGALEVLTPDCGILVPPGDVPVLAHTLDQLIASPETRRRLGQAGPARASFLCEPKDRLADLHKLLAALPARPPR